MLKKRLLILNHHGIGDILMGFPACRWLYTKPQFDIWMAVKGHAEMDLCTNERLGSQFITLSLSSKKELIEKLITLRRLKIDTVISWWSYSRLKVALFSYIIGAKHYYCPSFNKKDMYDRNTSHKYNKCLSVINHFLNETIPEGQDKDYYLDNTDLHFAKTMIGHQNYIVLFPGCGEKEQFKRWPIFEWVNFCNLFTANNPGYTIIISGSAKDSPLAEEIIIKSNLRNKNIVIKNICGKISIRQVAGVCKYAKFVIGGDNGGLHIANASGAKVVAIMGPTNSALTGPINPVLIIDQKLPGTPWYSKSSLKKRVRNHKPDISMHIPAKKVIEELDKLEIV